MKSFKVFRFFGILTIIFIFLLILAGGIVRSTGSGMGCPDWPTCYGHFIPPSDISEVVFKPNYNYKKKVFIIQDNKLYYSKNTFTSATQFNVTDWQLFEEHDYAEFNATHTWIESLNRYLGVFVGFWVTGLLVYSFLIYKKGKTLSNKINHSKILFYSFLAFLFVVIQGIIGKYLVASNLKSNLLMLHMLFTYTVLYAVIYVLYHTSDKNYVSVNNLKTFTILKIVILLSIIQTILGTQVTSCVEYLIKLDVSRSDLISNMNIWFYIHRSFSIIVLIANVYLFYLINIHETDTLFRNFALTILTVLFLEICFGVLLNYFDYPKFAQPLHLLLGTILISVQFYLFIICQKSQLKYND